MKKRVKYILFAVIIIAGASFTAIYAIQPLSVEVFLVEPENVRDYFVQRSYVRDDDQIQIFSLLGGELIYVHIEEGDKVNIGDIIAEIDTRDTVIELLHQIEQTRINNLALVAQINNLVVEENRIRDEQIANRQRLQGELAAIYVQANLVRLANVGQQTGIEENIRLQNILIEQTKNNLEIKEDDLDRAHVLFAAGAIPQVEVEALEQAVENQRMQLLQNEQQLEIIMTSEVNIIDQSDYFITVQNTLQDQINLLNNIIATSYIDSMRSYFQTRINSGNLEIAELERNIERTLELSRIVSPVQGIVTDLHIDFTNVVTTTQPVAEIRIEGDIFVESLVPAANISELQLNTPVEMIFFRQNGYIVYTGIVYEIDTRAVPVTSVLGVEERRVEVIVQPNKPNSYSFINGINVDVRFITYESENNVLIPRTAIFVDNGQTKVYMISEEGRAIAVPVELGRTLRTQVVVIEGINFGDIIIRNANQPSLTDGVRVTG